MPGRRRPRLRYEQHAPRRRKTRSPMRERRLGRAPPLPLHRTRSRCRRCPRPARARGSPSRRRSVCSPTP
ncbi:hypothetical protein CIK77_00510 [Microbacterium sp. JB110]|nr:hypothetical protein CIK77_00510 [Microbacterium sp. JB110]